MFEPPLALASLSGESDADWALAGARHAGAAFLGGIALDGPSREAARALVARGRREFLPADPLAFVDAQLARVAAANADPARPSIRPAINVRATAPEPIAAAASVCADHGAICEINAHCRQPELRAVGCGEALLADTDRLSASVAAAADAVDRGGADTTDRAGGDAPAVCVKVRAGVAGVDLVTVAETIEAAGADAIHVDAMDSEPVVGAVAAATDLFVIANNEVRDRESVEEYFDFGADAVSVGRPSREPDGPVLRRVADAVDAVSAASPPQGTPGAVPQGEPGSTP